MNAPIDIGFLQSAGAERRYLKTLRPAARRAALKKLGEKGCEDLQHDWKFWARPEQYWRPEWPERTCLWQTGRGFGKTRGGGETVNMVAEDHPEMCGGEIGIIGQTATDMRDVMVEGKSGIMATCKPWFTPVYEPSKQRITWPNGVVAHTRTSEKPKLIRGLSIGFAWCDELAHWFDPEECWDNLDFATREGRPSRIIATTTPLPTKFLKSLIADPNVRVIRGSTGDNAENLDPEFIETIERKYGGSRKGRQEIDGEIVEDNENAPFETDWIQRIARDAMPKLAHVAVGIDPAGGSKGKTSDETGIIGMGIDEHANLYVIADRSGKMSSAKWSVRGVDLGMVLRVEYSVETVVTIVGEVNFGGDMVELALKSTSKWALSGLRFEPVTALVDKATRADPIAQEAELGRYYHVGTGTQFRELENQMTQFDPTIPRRKQSSPDRMDAMVHVATFLLQRFVSSSSSMKALDKAARARVLAKLSQGYRG